MVMTQAHTYNQATDLPKMNPGIGFPKAMYFRQAAGSLKTYKAPRCPTQSADQNKNLKHLRIQWGDGEVLHWPYEAVFVYVCFQRGGERGPDP